MGQRFSKKVVVVTGASSGIGSAAAREFCAEGAAVVLVARSAEKLEKVAAELRASGGSAARAFPADVSNRVACAELLRKVVEDFGGIDVLVNNAGANWRGPIEQHAAEDLAALVDVNLTAPIVLTRLALPYLRQRGGGAIVNVASIAGQVPVTHEAVYSATKFGLRAFTFALREELEGSQITASVVSPGPVDTDFIMTDLDRVPDMVFANPMSTAEEVAHLILDCAIDGARERTIPIITGYMARVGNAFPALRRAVTPFLSRRGQAVKQRHRARQRVQAE